MFYFTTALVVSSLYVYRCPATNDVAVILELQTAASERQSPVTRAWCRVDVFNEAGWIMAGCWRLPLRAPPVDILSSTQETFGQQVSNSISRTLRPTSKPYLTFYAHVFFGPHRQHHK